MGYLSELIIEGHKIKNLIFDWGGVITNIDYNKSVEEFKKLGMPDFTRFYTQVEQIELFDLLEEGRIGPEGFRNEIRKFLPNTNLTDEQIELAWTALLLDTPEERITLLESLRPNFRMFLLSNTNQIHYGRMRKKFRENHSFDFFHHLFDKVYLSHELHDRKPNPGVFELVLKENNLKPSETLFIDDTLQHIVSAKKLGIVTHFLEKPQTIVELFAGFKQL